jgi:hypothetical protein
MHAIHRAMHADDQCIGFAAVEPFERKVAGNMGALAQPDILWRRTVGPTAGR